MQYVDQLQNKFYLEKTPQRIISLVPSITELLVDLGLQDSIVGVTKFCVHPDIIRKEKTIVGGTKNIKIELIKELNPDIILCNKEENTKEIVEACNAITTTHISDIYSISDTLQVINQYGKLFSCEEKATNIIDDILENQNNFSSFIAQQKSKKVAYFIWKKPWMVAANNTFINQLLEINKFDNVFKTKERYPEIYLKELQSNEKLEVVFLSSEPYPFKEKDILELQEKLPNIKIVLVDGEMFSWYGSRLIKAFDYFKKLHKEIN